MSKPANAASAFNSKWAARIRPLCWRMRLLQPSVENVVNAAFFSTGQKCTATSRVIVEEPHLRQVPRSADRAHQEAKGW